MPASTAPPALIVVVDDDQDMRESLEFLFEARGLATIGYGAAESLLAEGLPTAAACVVADVRLGSGMDGVALVEELRRRGHATPVVMVTGHGDVPLAVRAMRAGAVDFVEKPFGADRIFAAVADAIAAKASRGAGGWSAADRAEASALVAALTPRERQVLEELVAGKSNKAVAHTLGISPRTAEVYRAAIMQKLGAHGFADAVRIALTAGLGPGGRDG